MASAACQPEGTAAGLGRSERDQDLYVFDSKRNAVLLVAGDKAGQWESWYRKAIPLAEERYELYLKQEGHR